MTKIDEIAIAEIRMISVVRKFFDSMRTAVEQEPESYDGCKSQDFIEYFAQYGLEDI